MTILVNIAVLPGFIAIAEKVQQVLYPSLYLRPALLQYCGYAYLTFITGISSCNDDFNGPIQPVVETSIVPPQGAHSHETNQLGLHLARIRNADAPGRYCAGSLWPCMTRIGTG